MIMWMSITYDIMLRIIDQTAGLTTKIQIDEVEMRRRFINYHVPSTKANTMKRVAKTVRVRHTGRQTNTQ